MQRARLEMEQIDPVRLPFAAGGAGNRDDRLARMDRSAIQAAAFGTERRRPQDVPQFAARKVPHAGRAIVRRGDDETARRVHVEAAHRRAVRTLFDDEHRALVGRKGEARDGERDDGEKQAERACGARSSRGHASVANVGRAAMAAA